MNDYVPTAAAVAIAYLIGSLSFAVIVSRAFGLPDPRSYGSGNPGATNVLRSGSRLAALLTLAGDAGKGWLAVMLALLLAQTLGLTPAGIALVAFAVFAGHLYPVFYRFRGGKGVATAAGVLLALDPWLGLATLLTWLVIMLFFRYSSFAAVVASVFAPFYAFWLFGVRPVTWAVIAIALLLLWRHRGNIRRLLAGTEPRIGTKSAAARDPA